jgi:RecA/RadA recombinase
MSFIKNIKKMTGNEYSGIVEDGIQANDISGYLDTGCYALNAVLSGSIYGGIANNKVIALAGDSGVGKTYLALGIIRAFLENNPEGEVVYFESEAAVTSDMIKNRKIDAKRIAIVGVTTVEEFRNQCIKVVDEYLKMSIDERKAKPLLLILDSLGMLSTSKEMADTAEGKETADMTRARVIKSVFRVLTLKLGKAGVPLLLTNHVYNSMKAYAPKQQSGGTGLKYAASTIVMLSKSKEKEGDAVVGNVLHAKIDKGRQTKENSQVDLLLRYDSGLNKYYGLLDLAAKYNIFKKVSTRYEMLDGTKVFEKEINENPEQYFTPEILKQIDIAAGKEFKYASDTDAK